MDLLSWSSLHWFEFKDIVLFILHSCMTQELGCSIKHITFAKLKCFQMIWLIIRRMWPGVIWTYFYFMGIENSWGFGLWGWSELVWAPCDDFQIHCTKPSHLFLSHCAVFLKFVTQQSIKWGCLMKSIRSDLSGLDWTKKLFITVERQRKLLPGICKHSRMQTKVYQISPLFPKLFLFIPFY